MKQKKSNWHIAKVVTRNLARLFWAIVCYLAIEARVRVKWFAKNIAAFIAGYGSYAKMMQMKLDHNHRMYRDMKKYPSGFIKGGKVHEWDEMVLY